MPNDINEMKKFVNNVKKLVEKKVNNAKTDTSKKAIVQSLNEDGTANIIINGEVYNNVKIRAGLQPQINEVVLVSIPNNNTKDMFIDLASSTSTPGEETNHTHSNLSILETITQALINAWNSAVSHISDTIKHITSDERNLWNTVSNKVDKIEGKGLSTEDYTTAEKNKLSGITNNATRVESSPINGNIKINGVETNVYTHPSNHNANIIIEDSTHRFVTDAEKNTWNNKQNSLENLPTIYNVASDDTFIVKQSSDGEFKKVSKADFLASVSSDEFVFLVKREEFTATEGQTVFNLTKGYYVPNNNRISVYIWGNKQPNTAFSETSSTSVVLSQPVEAGTKVLIEWFQLINVIDYVHASTHAINGEDPITPAMIGAETPENAQQKANQAEANAKAYTDNKTTTYIHYQTSPSNSWIINHNLTKHPSVTIVDSAGNVVIGDVKYIDNNTINVVFAGTFSGIAYLN